MSSESKIFPKYPGITPRGNSIEIAFTYKGARIRESVRVKATATSLKEMSRKRQIILYEIDLGNFDFSKHFPNSKNLLKHSKNKGSFLTVEHQLKNWLLVQEKRCAYSTVRGYSTIVYHHLIPFFGDDVLTDVTTAKVNDFIDSLHCSPKRINNILSPLRAIFKESFLDGLIDKNPLDRIRNLQVTLREANPFKADERENILNFLKPNPQYHNLIQFAFFSGLRSSELAGLQWHDIDFEHDRIYVRRALVYNREKTTKTNSGLRTVELVKESREALIDQMQFKKNENSYVFLDANKNWSDSSIRKKVWIPALKSCRIEYRNPYQTRHTYASMMLSAGVNPMKVAAQMGHKDWGMIRQIYGRWIPPENS